jgi:heavy metal translocating P-type ATPase
VYHILHNSGILSDPAFRQSPLYQRCLQLGVIARPEVYNSEEDTGAIHELPLQKIPHQKKITLELSGLWCPSCAWLIERVLKEHAGVISAQVNFAADTAEIIFNPLITSTERTQKAVQELGYGASLQEVGAIHELSLQESSLLLRLGVAWAFSLNIMMLSMVLYVGYFEELTGQSRWLFPYLTALLTLPVIFYCAAPLWRRAFYSLYYRVPTMELLIALGVFSSFGYSIYEMQRGGIKVYFEVSAMIVALVLLGKYLEAAARKKAESYLYALPRFLPKKFRASPAEVWKRVEAITAKDCFWVKAGEKIPADGKIEDGTGTVDESLLSGESKPVSKGPGQIIRAGSLLLQGNVCARALGGYENFILSQITSLVAAVKGQKTRRERLVDRISYYFIIIVILGALVNFALLLLGQRPLDVALVRSIALLVIACPCALGIATPLAVAAAVNRAMNYGILIKNAEALERAKTIDTIILDKTGTLTRGNFKIQNTVLASADDYSLKEILKYAAAVENCSNHPLAAAFMEEAQRAGVQNFKSLPRVENYREISGVGVEGVVEGKKIVVGNKVILDDTVGAQHAVSLLKAEQEGKTVLFITMDGQLAAAFELGDELRTEAASVVKALQAQGQKVLIASGDSATATGAVSALVGADGFRAPLSHQEKIEWILSLRQQGRKVAMVGDGVNDGPALAAADLGVAVSSGTDLAKEAADLTLLGQSLSPLTKAIKLSQKTDSIIRQNLIWAFFYNVLGLGLAATGILSPLWAAAAMLLSSLSVVGNSLRIAKL